MTGFKTISRLTALTCTAILMTACGQSLDQHIYTSTAHRPTTIMVYDELSQQPLWTKEIPVGQTLMLDFDRAGEKEEESISLRPATSLKWTLYVDDPDEPIDEDEMNLPGTPVSMKVTYRTDPSSTPPPYQSY